ncbi:MULTISPECIES: putative bifunctional diguanylate cyclase/phosphodiesterase [unclassified Aureimonas]|uniref:putative bifunctional diguanylate cyclase/phosphodiesterase n=1 Tax=unclassified Aureimonas TaxID=2615206 RepID=UPI000A63A29C|nr:MULTISPECIES: bifunctional diguanylate cyclase/phosphodiesterase [unclassified Aureimonas]
MLNTAKRYWATCLGGGVILGFVVLNVLNISHDTVGSLVENSMKAKGRNFADLLLDGDRVGAFITGISRDPDAEVTMRRVASLANIDSFIIFDAKGETAFSTRSDRYEWLLRDRPGGIGAGDRLSPAILQRTGDWQIVYDDGKANASVVTPLVRDGRTMGYVSIVADLTADRNAYTTALAHSSLWLIATLVAATGLPALLFIRRQRRMADADDRIAFLANQDPLTHLLNRTRMKQECERVIATSRATREDMAFCYIDIDGLSDINDEVGVAQGDELLRVVAQRLSAVVDRSDLLARIGADDFLLLHRRMGGQEELAELVERMKRAVREPLELKGKTIQPQISIGVACLPKDGRTYGELSKHAEVAHSHQKDLKSGSFTLFEPHMDEATHHRREIESKVRAAVENDGFELFYQPIVDGGGTRLLGFEALIRMPDGKGGHISPGTFVPIAESRGYIKAMGSWVIEEAARQAALWPKELFVSVNLSAVQFRDGQLVKTVEDALAAAGIPGSRLEIEVVESLLLERTGDILGQLKGLKALGISIDMDDFGTGYSSLGYLWRFPFDKLKIDQSFMVAFDQGEANIREIVGTIVSLAKQMHMKVTAEGVETAEQAAFLSDLGCDQLQGYHFGKPMPADRIAAEVLTRFRLPAPPAAIALDRTSVSA